MSFSERIAEQVKNFPAELKSIIDQQLAAGNEFVDMELGRAEFVGTVILVMNHPFRTTPESLPTGIKYRELLDRDPRFYQYLTDDEKWILMTAKFKPMVFEPITGPPDPMPAHLARMKIIHEREEAAAADRAAGRVKYVPPSLDPSLGDAGQRFLSSMTMTFDMWHDGLGYDLDALKSLSPKELESVATILINHHPLDWRDIEALAMIDLPKAHAAVEAALKHSNPDVRRVAMDYAGEKIDPADREQLLLKSIPTAEAFGGLTPCLDEIEKFHPPSIIDAMLKRTRQGGESAVHFAAMLYYLHGKSKEAFDWDHRPFFLKFNSDDRNERIEAFNELCRTIGVDPTNIK